MLVWQVPFACKLTCVVSLSLNTRPWASAVLALCGFFFSLQESPEQFCALQNVTRASVDMEVVKFQFWVTGPLMLLTLHYTKVRLQSSMSISVVGLC